MSIVFDRSEIEQQLEAFEATLKDLEGYREVLQQTTALFANDTVRTLRGVYGESVRAYFNEVHLTVLRVLQNLIVGYETASQTLREGAEAVDKCPTAHIEEAYIREVLLVEIANFRKDTEAYYHQINDTASSVEDIISTELPMFDFEAVDAYEARLLELLCRLTEFDQLDVVSPLHEFQLHYMQLLAYMDMCSTGGTVNYTTGALYYQPFYAGLMAHNEPFERDRLWKSSGYQEKLRTAIAKRPEGMDEATYETYTEELMNDIKEAHYDGFDETALKAYIIYANEMILGKPAPEIEDGYLRRPMNIKEQLDALFATYQETGSPVFVAMFHASEATADTKLDLVYAHHNRYGKWSTALSKESVFYNDINQAVVQSNVFVFEQGKEPSAKAAFFHYDMRHYLNQQGAFAPYANCTTDQEALQAMREDGWHLVEEDSGNADGTILFSRYHGMLLEGYASIEAFKAKHGYDPTKNVKLLSKDSKHERIYNTELGKFVDVEPYSVTPESISKHAVNDPFRNTANNMPTYNYGYSKDGKRTYKHTAVDVNPFTTFGGSMEGITMDMTSYKGVANLSFIPEEDQEEKNSKINGESRLTNKENQQRKTVGEINLMDLKKGTSEAKDYSSALGQQEYIHPYTGKKNKLKDDVKNFWKNIGVKK